MTAPDTRLATAVSVATASAGLPPRPDITREHGFDRRTLQDLRSDQAGETGAVQIYRGMLAVSRNAAVREFASRHLDAEAEHLRLIDEWLPASERSRLLPIWRVAGWITGALPAAIGPRWVYATVRAVETFVDQHYGEQIERLESARGDPVTGRLLDLLIRCRADECHHRDEAAAALGDADGHPARGSPLWLWTWLVGFGSALAVHVCRRV